MQFTKEQTGKTHNLKIWPEYFAAVRDGLKRAELRWNEYQAGDILDLCEWDQNEEAFTGEYISVKVTHVAELGQWMPGYVLLSIALPAQATSAVQEPVADVVAWSSPTEERTCDIRWRRHDVAPGPLYTAPPAPVVPAEIRNRFRAEGLAELLKDVRDYAPLTAGQWETLTKNWHQTFVGLSGEGDACRAAMLTDAPQQEAQ